MASSYPSPCLCHCYESMSDSLFENAASTNVQGLYELHATKSTSLRKCAWFLEAQKAVQSKSTSSFACRRCSARFPSNTKLHEHIRCHHAKKSKPAVSSSSTPSTPPSTPPQSVVSLVGTAKPAQPKALPPTPLHSVTSPPSTPKRNTSPKRSPLSGSAPEFVPKRSGNTSTCPLTPPSTPPQKPASMRPTPPFTKSAFATPTKPYLTITDLFSMFAGKSMRAKLFPSQNSPSSPGISAPRQARITSYFLPTSAPKSTKSEASTAVHAPVKQSARATPSRSPFRPSPSSPSARFSFSTTPYSSPVCWHCQAPLATYLHSNGCLRVAGKAGIPVGRRGRRLFRKVWADC